MNYTRKHTQRLLIKQGSFHMCHPNPFEIGYWAAHVGEPAPDDAKQRRGWDAYMAEMASEAAAHSGGET